MAGGMNRRGERVSLHERIHGVHPTSEPEPVPEAQPSPGRPSALRHCWVTDEHGRHPGLLLEWRRTVPGWQGRVVRPVLEAGDWIVVEEWLQAEKLEAQSPRFCRWWGGWGSNPRPRDYESLALTD